MVYGNTEIFAKERGYDIVSHKLLSEYMKELGIDMDEILAD